MTKTNSKIEVLFKNLMLRTGVCNRPHVFTDSAGVSIHPMLSSYGAHTALYTIPRR